MIFNGMSMAVFQWNFICKNKQWDRFGPMGSCLQTSGPGSDNLLKKKNSVCDIFGRDSDEIHSWDGFAKLKGKGIVLHKTTISAQDSDTSCKFGDPQGHPHF